MTRRQALALATPVPRDSWTGDLVLGAVVLIVTVRAFTELVPVLPRAANVIDIPLLALLAGVAMVRPAPPRAPDAIRIAAVLFLVVAALSGVANLTRVAAGPAALFLYGFLAPVAYYVAVYRLWPAGRALALSRVLVVLAAVQLVVVLFVNVPRFSETGNPDEISGTFGENAYQLVFFLVLTSTLLAGIMAFERQRAVARVAPALIALSFIVVLLAQFRALLVTLGLATLFASALLARARSRGVLIAGLVVCSLALGTALVSAQYPALKFAPTIDVLVTDPGLLAGKRLDVASDVLDLYGDEPHFALIGTGPGTFSSRAWRTFALAGSTSESNVGGEYVLRLTGGELYRTDVSERYVIERLRAAEVVLGSRALTQPYSSYVALLAEVGVVGFALVLFLYLGALARAVRMTFATTGTRGRDAVPALVLASAVGFFTLLQMGLLENWLETTRVAILPWVLLAVATKEFEARDEGRAT